MTGVGTVIVPCKEALFADARRLSCSLHRWIQAKAPGIDLVATLGGRWLAVEVKGYPETTYADAARRGQPKRTNPANQANKWFSHALLAMMRMRHKRPDAEIALCFPDFGTYRRLLAETQLSFEQLGFGVYFTSENCTVELALPHRTVLAPR